MEEETKLSCTGIKLKTRKIVFLFFASLYHTVPWAMITRTHQKFDLREFSAWTGKKIMRK